MWDFSLITELTLEGSLDLAVQQGKSSKGKFKKDDLVSSI